MQPLVAGSPAVSGPSSSTLTAMTSLGAQPSPAGSEHGDGRAAGDAAAPAPGERSRYALAAFMAGAGAMHFIVPGVYEKIVPRWLGHERAVVRWSGVAEALCGALLALPRTKRAGAWLTVVTLLAVYPANVQMAIEAGVPRDALGLGTWLRLPLQVPLIGWAYRHTGDRPARPRSTSA